MPHLRAGVPSRPLNPIPEAGSNTRSTIGEILPQNTAASKRLNNRLGAGLAPAAEPITLYALLSYTFGRPSRYGLKPEPRFAVRRSLRPVTPAAKTR